MRFNKAEVAQALHDCLAGEPGKCTAACGTLQREHGEFIGTLAHAHVESARDLLNDINVGAPAGEQPPASFGVLPQRRVNEHSCIILQQQRVNDAPCFERGERARLHVVQKSACSYAFDFDDAHERKVEQPNRAASGEMLIDCVHSARTSMKTPTATHSVPATRRNALALTACATRTPAATPASSNPVTHAASAKSMRPSCSAESEPDTDAMICNT